MDTSKIAEILVSLEAVKTQAADAQAKLADVEAFVAAEKQATKDLVVAEYEAKLIDVGNVKFEEGKIAGYAIGFEDGKNSAPTTPSGYTQEQVDVLVAEAVDPLKKSLAEKELEIAALKESIPSQVNEQVQIAIVALKEELQAKYKKAKEIEDQAEAEFEGSLKA